MTMEISKSTELDRFRERPGGGSVPSNGPDDDVAVRRAVRAAKAGDWDAIRYLYVRYADAVHRSVAQVLRDEHEAEDVTQQVFLKLRTAIAGYEPRTAPFRTWLFRVARNVALDDMRARRCVPTEELEGRAPDERGHERGLTALRDGLAALPHDQRNVLYLRHVLGLAPGEIAARLGKSESAVHGLHHRGRLALQMELRRLQAAPAVRSVPDVVAGPPTCRPARRRRRAGGTGTPEVAVRAG